MPRILRILTRMNVGGPARHVLRIAGPIAARGWDTTLVTGRPDPGEGDLADAARAAGHDVVVLDGLGRSPRPAADLAALLALRRLIAARRPAVVHTHTAKAGVVGRLAALSVAPRPVIVHTFHGHVLSGYFGPAASRACARLERFLARRSDALVAVCASVARELAQEHRVAEVARFTVVPTGVDLLRCAPDAAAGAALRAALRVGGDEVLVGVVGRLAPVKRVGLVVQAVARARERGAPLRLLVTGDGPQGARLRAVLDRRPWAAWQAPRDDLGATYAAIDLLALPSRREGQPQAVIEALAAGVPVVATAVGGVAELLRHGRDGWLLPDGPDAEVVSALAGALHDLSRDRGRRAALSAAARARRWDGHGATAVAARLADLYEERLAARGGARRPASIPCTSSS